MIALWHYTFLKGMRDRSLPVFLLWGPVYATAALIGVSVAQGRLHYPLSPQWDIKDELFFALMTATVIATLSAFWTLRTEVATKAIGSFLMATRPISVVVALVVFAAATGVATEIGMIVVSAVVRAALPANLVPIVLATVILSLAAASMGALCVTISPQPAMLIWAFCGSLPLVAWMANPSNWPRLVMIAPVIAILCTAISAFLLRRRCAT